MCKYDRGFVSSDWVYVRTLGVLKGMIHCRKANAHRLCRPRLARDKASLWIPGAGPQAFGDDGAKVRQSLDEIQRDIFLSFERASDLRNESLHHTRGLIR